MLSSRPDHSKVNISKQNRERKPTVFVPNYLEGYDTWGASTWLTVLPLAEHRFALHKSAFQDVLALRYGWFSSKLPSKCECGHEFSVDYTLSCAKGGFPALHNKIRDITCITTNRSVQ